MNDINEANISDLVDLMRETIELSKESLSLVSTEKEFSHFREEMAELILEMERKNRGRSDDDKILEEIVDVFIFCIKMGIVHYGIENFNTMVFRKNDKFRASIERYKRKVNQSGIGGSC